MTTYAAGTTARISVSFAVDGVLTDPGTVSLTVTDPTGTATEYTYAGATVTKSATGEYYKDLVVSIVGSWTYLWVGTAPVATTQSGGFIVQSSTTATKQTLVQSVAKEFGFTNGYPSSTGSTTTIVDVSGDSPLDALDASQLYQNAWVRIESDSAATPLNVGEVRRISDYAESIATLTLNRALSNATTTTQQYGVYFAIPPTRFGVFKGIDEYINETLSVLRHESMMLLTLAVDGDMETSGISAWTASDATLSKVTSAANVQLGKQALRVQNSAANGYARPALINVVESQNFAIVADVRVASGTAKLLLYDETNGAEIQSVECEERQSRWLRFQGTIPTDCMQVSVRLIGKEATADIYWDNVSVRDIAASRIDLPSNITSPGDILEVEVWSGGTTYLDSYATDGRMSHVVPWWEVIEDTHGATPYRLEFGPRVGAYCHLFARVLRAYDTLVSDSAETDADADLVKAGALYRIALDRADLRDRLVRWPEEYRRLLLTHRPKMRRRIKVRPD